MKAAIYDRFWHSMGGGERHAGMIAQVLARVGYEVDLIGHSDVSMPELSSRLALDLSGTRLRIVPDRGEDAISEVSAEYELFVNATYMSRVVARARRSVYLCFFPTPFDHDLGPMHRAAIRAIGPHLENAGAHEPAGGFRYGTGWFPPEGGRRRQWVWSNGDGRLSLTGSGPVQLQADFGRPGTTEPIPLTIEVDQGEPTVIEVTPGFTQHTITLPPAKSPREVRFLSRTFSPGPRDPRELGIAVSRLRVVGNRMTTRQRLALRYPWLLRSPGDLGFLDSYRIVLANSAYTQRWIETLWRTPSKILYPPIEVSNIVAQAQREKVILSVGRFFAPGHGHSKRQLEMVRMFGKLVRSGQLAGWRFVVLGGCEDSQRGYLEAVTAAANGLPVEIHANAPRALVQSQMASAAVFWSATGLRENTEKRPWTNEHFGMTTAEAMAGGCVPIVIDRAGQREIVREGVDGFRWADPAQLCARTTQVTNDEALRARLAASARERAHDFSDHAFTKRWNELADEYDLVTRHEGRLAHGAGQ